MIRHLLATTALATFALAASGAFAADEMKKPGEATPVFQMESKAELMADELGYFSASETDILASNLLGATIYNGAGEDAEALGDVNDLVMAASGTAEAVVIGVGGFLGMGEKEVAVDFERLSWVERDGDRWLTLEASKEELEAAPEYERPRIDTDEQLALAAQEEKKRMTGEDKMAATAEAEDDTKVMAKASDATAAAGAQVTEEKRDIRAQLSPATTDAISADKLIGATVYDANNDNIGEIGDVLIDNEKISTFIVDVGGFLGIGEKPVAVDINSIEIMTDESGSLWVFTPFTEEQLEGHIEYSEAEFESDPDRVILR